MTWTSCTVDLITRCRIRSEINVRLLTKCWNMGDMTTPIPEPLSLSCPLYITEKSSFLYAVSPRVAVSEISVKRSFSSFMMSMIRCILAAVAMFLTLTYAYLSRALYGREGNCTFRTLGMEDGNDAMSFLKAVALYCSCLGDTDDEDEEGRIGGRRICENLEDFRGT